MKYNIRFPAVRIYSSDGREVCFRNKSGREEYRNRTHQMADRQGWKCGLCGGMMDEFTVSFDHEHGRGMGGAKRDDRIEVDGVRKNAAVHFHCNHDKGSRYVPYVVQ